MDIKSKRLVPGAQGSAASNERLDWYADAGSWQYGANCNSAAIRAEARENNLRWGTPDDDNCPNPAASNGDGDAPLGNPHNFSSNPGYMGTSTASMLSASAPGNGKTGTIRRAGAPGSTAMKSNSASLGRSVKSTRGNVAMPAPGDIDPSSEGSPQGRTSGFGG